MTHNPYSPPASDVVTAVPEDTSELARIRKEHIGTETNVKSIGLLALIGGFGSLAIFVTLVVQGALDVLTFSIVVSAALLISSGVLLRRLEPVGRVLFTASFALNVASIILSGAAAQGIGRLVLPAVLTASLWSVKANTVFTMHYRSVVIPATPHIKYRSWAVWLLLVILVAVAIAVLVGVLSK